MGNSEILQTSAPGRGEHGKMVVLVRGGDGEKLLHLVIV